MKKRRSKKLVLRKETLTRLQDSLHHVVGGLKKTIDDTVWTTEPQGCEPLTHTCISDCEPCGPI